MVGAVPGTLRDSAMNQICREEKANERIQILCDSEFSFFFFSIEYLNLKLGCHSRITNPPVTKPSSSWHVFYARLL